MTATAQERHVTACRYREFAEREARGQSPHYEKLALEIAGCETCLAFLNSLPVGKRQPNLFLAAIRHVAGVPSTIGEVEAAILAHCDRITNIMLSRATQTNEPGRCAVLLPVLARLPQPLAIIEVGASAGLCLLPDRYAYDYGRHRLNPADLDQIDAPILSCQANAMTPLPARMPEITWRCGLDLKPLDVMVDADMDWLRMLIWPGQDDRRARLEAAISVARRHPPEIRRGNLLQHLPAVVASAPRDAHLVIFHTAVLAYVRNQADRNRFADVVRNCGATWISNEAPAVFPQMACPSSTKAGQFLLSVDGKPCASTGPHGQSIDWMAE